MNSIICTCIISFAVTVVQFLYLMPEYNKKKVLIFSVASCVLTIGCTLALIILYDSSIVQIIKAAILTTVLATAALIDYKKMIVPNTIIVFGLIVRLIIYFVELYFGGELILDIVKSDLFAVAIIVVFFGIALLIVRKGIGMGDIKLMIIIALYIGFEGIIGALFMSMICVFILAIVLLIARRKRKNDVLPFAPALLVGTVISIILNGM